MKTLRPRLATFGASPAQPGGWAARARPWKKPKGWDRTRLRIRARANDLCEPHLALGIVHVGCQCDHKLPTSQGGSDDGENLHWVCEPFHKAKTLRESRGETVNIDELARETAGGRVES